MNHVKVGCLQMEIAKGDPAANLGKVRDYAAKAGDAGVRILLLPELWSTGFAYRELPRLARETPSILEELGALARDHGVAIAGSLPELDGGKLFNTLYAVDTDGGVKSAYRKVHLFPGFKEDVFLERGSFPVQATLHGLRVGSAICFDLRFPELFRKLALAGAQVAIVSAEWPKERLDHWRVLNRARAIENQFFVLATNSVGHHGRTVFGGHSMIVDPLGEITAEAGDHEELLTGDINAGEVQKAREGVNFLSCRVRGADEFLSLS